MNEKVTKHEYITDRWRPQDDVPDEVWLKNFIEAYRRQERDMEQLRAYARGLEEENVMLQKRLSETPENWQEMKAENEQLKRLLRQNSVIPLQLRQSKQLRSLLRQLNRYTSKLLALLISHGIDIPPLAIQPKNHPLLGVDVEKLEEEMLMDYFSVTSPKLAEKMKSEAQTESAKPADESAEGASNSSPNNCEIEQI